MVDNAPLFWQPCQQFYAIRAGKNTSERLNAYRNVGRIMAICMLQNELCPITLTRHVLKYVLGRSIKWHDLAFYDPAMYESFRKMICDAERLQQEQADERIFKPLDLTFNVDLCKEEGGPLNVDLVENGANIKVILLL